eukprot:SAG25_NODE_11408_length_305_cov_0.742718_1_plen_41_part_10
MSTTVDLAAAPASGVMRASLSTRREVRQYFAVWPVPGPMED